MTKSLIVRIHDNPFKIHVSKFLDLEQINELVEPNYLNNLDDVDEMIITFLHYNPNYAFNNLPFDLKKIIIHSVYMGGLNLTREETYDKVKALFKVPFDCEFIINFIC